MARSADGSERDESKADPVACPNWQETETRVREALRLAGAPATVLSLQTVSTPEDADRLGFRGSPTVLVDGVDPFASPSAPGVDALSVRDDVVPVVSTQALLRRPVRLVGWKSGVGAGLPEPVTEGQPHAGPTASPPERQAPSGPLEATVARCRRALTSSMATGRKLITTRERTAISRLSATMSTWPRK